MVSGCPRLSLSVCAVRVLSHIGHSLRLRQVLVSTGNPALAAFPHRGVSVVGILTPSGMSEVRWKMAEPSQHFDWPGYLARLYRRQAQLELRSS